MEGDPLPHYFPPFLWRFWFSSDGNGLDVQFMHIYDVFKDELAEIRRMPDAGRSVFHDFDNGVLDPGCKILRSPRDVPLSCYQTMTPGFHGQYA
ncbi:hypothetical protein OE88DRAFT_1654200 [Heliocybe sulcata]|uniref:Uncharacterized protein n=1 Tax=Heliocybe sulcata TaxID=5364 RepID=A0A5C3N947_9AGAM|nr:hypothetical protein OE88DRAFT_1654200 [Heliocybe sulcata]